jgi:hypothetical protein
MLLIFSVGLGILPVQIAKVNTPFPASLFPFSPVCKPLFFLMKLNEERETGLSASHTSTWIYVYELSLFVLLSVDAS